MFLSAWAYSHFTLFCKNEISFLGGLMLKDGCFIYWAFPFFGFLVYFTLILY